MIYLIKLADWFQIQLKCSVSFMISQFYHDKLCQPISEFQSEQQQDSLIQSSKSKEILTKDRFIHEFPQAILED